MNPKHCFTGFESKGNHKQKCFIGVEFSKTKLRIFLHRVCGLILTLQLCLSNSDGASHFTLQKLHFTFYFSPSHHAHHITTPTTSPRLHHHHAHHITTPSPISSHSEVGVMAVWNGRRRRRWWWCRKI